MAEKKKAVSRKNTAPVKKAVAVKSATASRPSVASKKATAPKKAAPPARPAPVAPLPVKKSVLNAKELERFKAQLLSLRSRLTGQISALASESLTVADETPSEDRTDDFDREFALNVAGSVQDALFEIDEALRRMDDGRYGICEISAKPIEKERLKALPYARYCVSVQAEMERGRTRYRPFGNALAPALDRESPTVEATEEQE